MLRDIMSAFFEDQMRIVLTEKLMTRSKEPVHAVLRPDVYITNGDDSYICSGQDGRESIQPVPPETLSRFL